MSGSNSKFSAGVGSKGIFTNLLTSPSRSMGSYHGRSSVSFHAASCSSVALAGRRSSALVPSTAESGKLPAVGMTSCFSFVFAKALSPTEAEALRRTLSSAEPSNAPSPMAAACDSSTLVSAVLANAPAPMVAMFFISAVFSAVFAKALSPISVTPAPSVSAVTPLPSNMRAGIAPASTVTSLKAGRFANTPAGMIAGSH